MSSDAASTDGKPEYVVKLEKVYGTASQDVFGSSVYFDPAENPERSLEKAALAKYQYSMGEKWERFGRENWLGEWSLVYQRATSAERDIVAELRAIQDNGARLSASLLLNNIDNDAEARRALANAFDDMSVSELRIFKIGDGGVMSGVLIAARRPADGTVFLLILMD